MNTYRSFEDLSIYKKSCLIRKEVYELVKTFPNEEKFRLVDQIIRSTRKCPANIAEGHGRFHFQENTQFNRIARGSLTETIDHLNVALECAYVTNEIYLQLKDEITALIKMINGYIRYLNKEKSSSKHKKS